MRIPKTLHRYIETADDERSLGNGIIITLRGRAFQDANTQDPLHVAGFDTWREAAAAIRGADECHCGQCRK